MTEGYRRLGSEYQRDWSLTILLAVLVVDAFVLGTLTEALPMLAPSRTVLFLLFLLSGISLAFQHRTAVVPIAATAIANVVLQWVHHIHPSFTVAYAEGAALLFCVLLIRVVLAQVFRQGPITAHRIQGAIAVYLLLAFTWGFAYELVALADSAAFNMPITGLYPQPLRAQLLYFSTITLTTTGYGDITPVNPVARSLAGLEGLTGQLFPAILLARLVSMELYSRQQSR
ncbi:MAG TPA: ion channel [Candidatus Binatia bacterium]|nr:ion channel [Candidatus Binatia bacterium]